MARITGISSGSSSVKTTIARRTAEVVPDFRSFPQDNYYRSAEHITNQNITEFDFDHPSAFDNDLLWKQLNELRGGGSNENALEVLLSFIRQIVD